MYMRGYDNARGLGFGGPDGWGLDVVGGAAAGVLAAGTFEAADDFDRHVVVAEDLAGEADAGHVGEPARGHHIFFGLGHGGGFAGDELDSAGGAAGVTTTGVELVGVGFVGEGVDQALTSWNLECAVVFDGEFGHSVQCRVGGGAGTRCVCLQNESGAAQQSLATDALPRRGYCVRCGDEIDCHLVGWVPAGSPALHDCGVSGMRESICRADVVADGV